MNKKKANKKEPNKNTSRGLAYFVLPFAFLKKKLDRLQQVGISSNNLEHTIEPNPRRSQVDIHFSANGHNTKPSDMR